MTDYLTQHPFDNIARTFWDKIAIYSQETSISYGELYISTNQLAHSLRAKGIRRGDRVAFILPKSINSIKAILGIMKADGIYVPIDSKAPLQRAKELIEDCSPSAIICDIATVDLATSLLRLIPFQPLLVNLGVQLNNKPETGLIQEKALSVQKAEMPNYTNIDRDIAYILYTSGSTGRPKGVMISHLNICNYISWAIDYFQICAKDNILNTAPLHFDMAVFDIYCALQTGASLTLASEEALLFPVRLIEIIRNRKITIWKAVPSLLSHIVKMKALDLHRMDSLQKIIFSGEPLPTKYLIEWMKAYPNVQFFNAYGPTECTGISTCFRIPRIPLDPLNPVPIGKACANKEVFALREDGNPAEVGQLGELYIRGSCLSHGYWRDSAKTGRAFIPNSFNSAYEERLYATGDLVKQLPDGNYVFVGRKDHQIKHMGYRIELGEIESALQSLHSVKDAAAISFKREDGEKPEIIAFIELNRGADLNLILEDLKQILPKYMIPSKIHPLKNLPRTGNGKVDRQFLLDQYSTKIIDISN